MDLLGLTCMYLTSLWLAVAGEDYHDFDIKSLKTQPTFVDTPTNVTFKAGKLAKLDCSVNNLGTKKVIWRRASDFNPLTIGTKTFVGNSRILIEHTPLQKEWNLLIKKVQLDDGGKYECQVSSTQRNLRRFVYLNIIGEYKPSWRKPTIRPEPDIRRVSGIKTNTSSYDIKISGPSYVEKGSKILLVCNATGDEHPPDDLDWFKDGDKLSTDHSKQIYIRKQVSLEYKTISSVLEIEKARLHNAGVYICRTSDLQITRKIVDILNSDTYNVKRGTDKDAIAASHGIYSGNTFHSHRNNSPMLSTNSLHFFCFICIQTVLQLMSQRFYT
ncbi:hypothetical protein SNE40_011904 [Patella caerulea]|uniref:Ig-like domain-containing protein n=1 Tax=Patella caerulea TaxID=87958 RepID=A0AAN8PK98_PATCE